ncbi:hypothetical protein [Meridianimarinicoccus aquatilis]|uniref:Uncharacterized protein n=1 Tax=Meridianimarinicoccus aquatilis TaxID=2552766 RepID=A0A4R6ACG7_9RHOB|nr:hypothetical protein [Fluviibacterium aquatile]TDL81691.1 hypothetical protein E2L05_19940 [Fluviibacterium aquatile]
MKLERHVLETMPELEQSRTIEKDSERGAPEKTTGQTGDIAALVQAALSNSPDRQAFRRQLHAQGLELYIRGKTPGVVHLESGKKHRLKTLNLELLQAFEALPDAQLNESREKTAPEGEKEKGAEALPEPQRHQAQTQQPPDLRDAWRAELEHLRERHEQNRQAEAEQSGNLLRELRALVRFAVSDTLKGIRSRALKMLERLKIKPRQHEYERLRRDPKHERGR